MSLGELAAVMLKLQVGDKGPEIEVDDYVSRKGGLGGRLGRGGRDGRRKDEPGRRERDRSQDGRRYSDKGKDRFRPGDKDRDRSGGRPGERDRDKTGGKSGRGIGKTVKEFGEERVRRSSRKDYKEKWRDSYDTEPRRAKDVRMDGSEIGYASPRKKRK